VASCPRNSLPDEAHCPSLRVGLHTPGADPVRACFRLPCERPGENLGAAADLSRRTSVASALCDRVHGPRVRSSVATGAGPRHHSRVAAHPSHFQWRHPSRAVTLAEHQQQNGGTVLPAISRRDEQIYTIFSICTISTIFQIIVNAGSSGCVDRVDCADRADCLVPRVPAEYECPGSHRDCGDRRHDP